MKNMKYKLFVIIAVLALAIFFIFVYCSNESEHETINEDATRVEDSDESRTEVAEGPDKSPDAEPAMMYSTLAASPSYELVSKTYAKDIDKVMKSVSGLSTSGKTVLGGRRGEPSSLTSGGTMKLLAAST